MNELTQNPALVHDPAPDLAASQAELQRQAYDAPQPGDVPETAAQARVQQWGLAAAGLLADREVRRRASGWIALVAMSGVWGFGAGLGVDAALDGSPATVYRTAVMGHHVSHGRHTSYYLTLAPWGPQTEDDSVEVPWKTYAAFQVGDEVCVPLRAGTLGVAWYRVEGCR